MTDAKQWVMQCGYSDDYGVWVFIDKLNPRKHDAETLKAIGALFQSEEEAIEKAQIKLEELRQEIVDDFEMEILKLAQRTRNQ